MLVKFLSHRFTILKYLDFPKYCEEFAFTVKRMFMKFALFLPITVIAFFSAQKVLMSLRLLVTLILIAFIIPQTTITYYNFVVQTIYSLGFFLSYADVKQFVFVFTWSCIALYLLLNFVVTF